MHSGGQTIQIAIVKLDNGNFVEYECNCFTSGTLVQIENGTKSIENIKVGDLVLSKNDSTGEIGYKPVTGLFQKQAQEVYSLRVGDEVIQVTREHPFWVNGKGWTQVGELQVHDLLVKSNGEIIEISDIKLQKLEVTVYNFEVEGYNSYFITNLGVWVHNCEIGSYSLFFEGGMEYHGKGTLRRMQESIKEKEAE